MAATVAALAAAALTFSITAARGESLAPDARQAIYSGVLNALNSYVYPEVSEKMKAAIERRRPIYLEISDPDVFARTMTADLRAISQDKHVNLMAHSELPTEAPGARSRHADAIRSANSSYGFYDVRRLPGNIGYVDLHTFTDGPETRAYAAAVMTLVAHTGALIMDVRKNHGGLPNMAELLTGYLVGKRELIARVRTRHRGGRFDVENRFSIAPRSGASYGKPVYILTSNATFSAAEYFTYCLQSLERVQVVGETTGGGGNSGDVIPLEAGFSIFIPTGSIESPLTHKSWERTGVRPNVPAAASAALVEAYKRALAETKLDGHSEQEMHVIDTSLADPEAALKSSVQF